MVKSVFVDSYGNVELYLIPLGEDVNYRVKHKTQNYFTDLQFVADQGFLPDDYYPLTVLEWASVSDWKTNYLN